MVIRCSLERRADRNFDFATRLPSGMFVVSEIEWSSKDLWPAWFSADENELPRPLAL